MTKQVADIISKWCLIAQKWTHAGAASRTKQTVPGFQFNVGSINTYAAETVRCGDNDDDDEAFCSVLVLSSDKPGWAYAIEWMYTIIWYVSENIQTKFYNWWWNHNSILCSEVSDVLLNFNQISCVIIFQFSCPQTSFSHGAIPNLECKDKYLKSKMSSY